MKMTWRIEYNLLGSWRFLKGGFHSQASATRACRSFTETYGTGHFRVRRVGTKRGR
jgi:hypothetical protein